MKINTPEQETKINIALKDFVKSKQTGNTYMVVIINGRYRLLNMHTAVLVHKEYVTIDELNTYLESNGFTCYYSCEYDYELNITKKA